MVSTQNSCAKVLTTSTLHVILFGKRPFAGIISQNEAMQWGEGGEQLTQ